MNESDRRHLSMCPGEHAAAPALRHSARGLSACLALAIVASLDAQSLQLPTPPQTSLTINSGSTTYQAPGNITAAGSNTSVTISAPSTVTFMAGGQIVLLPGFTAIGPGGASPTFHALIAPVQNFTVAAPTFSPAAGPYTSAQTITIGTSTPGATIRYTTHGVTNPTETVGTPYTAPITVSTTTTVKAIAYETGWTDSAVVSAAYTITIVAPDLTITSTHTGNFLQGQTGATYTVTVTNSGTGPTNGTVTATDAVPAGLTSTAIAGTGWNCTQPSGPCTRNDILAAAASYPAIALTVTVAGNALSSVTNTATVSGGGETNTTNDTANDPTTVVGIGSSADPRRIGVRSTGSYWGSAGEQIDLLSGNLNFSLPLIQAKARGGWGATFALSYNSQTWVQNSGATSNLGRDIGYGLGWTFQAGAIVPQINYYLFRDSTGAEYRLDQFVNNIWTSIQGTHATFDANASKLYFPDGSFWLMNVQSASGEQDAGTLYPSQIEDSNGNYIQIQYGPGIGPGGAPNTSGRITQITDVRAPGSAVSYTFTYNSDPIPHLSNVRSLWSVPESYSFLIAQGALQSPFDGTPAGTAALLQQVTVLDPVSLSSLGLSYTFLYKTGTDEMTQVTMPLGGVLGWTYQTFTNSAGLGVRWVQNRTSSASAYAWTFQLDSQTPHASDVVTDHGAEGGSGSSKAWTFRTDSGPFQGLSSTYEERDTTGTLLHKDYTWTADGAGNVYLGSTKTTLNPGTSNAAQTATSQTLDTYGNVTQSQIYDYPNLTLARTYNYSYVTDPSYTSRYIRNRISSASVTPATGPAQTLVTNYYDVANTSDPHYCGPLRNHPQQPQPLLLFDYTNYPVSVTVRGNLSWSSQLGVTRCYAYEISGVPYQTVDAAGVPVNLTLDSSTNFSLPTALTPNTGNPSSDNNLAVNISYATSPTPPRLR